MQLSEVDSCDCVAGYVLVGGACQPCGDHEAEKNGTCVCDPGYTRASDSAPCAEIPTAGAGAPCSDVSPCSDPKYAFCARASNGDRYCTRADCRAADDCDEGYACSASEQGSYCQRSPRGLALPCESSADCAGSEATYCETLISHSCLVQGCSLAQDDCFSGWECCDVSSYGMPVPLCVPAGECPT